MKRIITLSAMMLLFLGSMFAQKLSYQAVVRNSQTNELMVSTTMNVTINILGANEQVLYTETHTGVQSNMNGLITLTIGEGTNATSSLNNVDWNGASIRSTITIQGIDPITITTPVNAVPYALQAANASGSFDQVQADWNETDENAKSFIKHKPTIPEAPDLSNYVTENKLNDTLNSYLKQEVDPTVPGWAKEANKPVYYYNEIQNTPEIPTVNDVTINFTQGNEALGSFTTNAAQGNTIDIPAPDLSNYVTLNKLNDTLGSYIKQEVDPTVKDGTLTITKGNDTYVFSANTDQNVTVDVTAPDLTGYVTVDEMKQAISDSLALFKAQLMAEVTTMLPTYMAGYMADYMAQNLPTLMQPYMEALNIHTASELTVITPNNIQQSLTLANTPKEDTEVLMYINGVMVGSTASDSGVISVNNKTVTYNPNANYGYNLQAGDKVTFVYVY